MLENLAQHSRVWVYQADRILKPNEIQLIEQTLSEFLPQWASHGNELYGDFTVAESLFIIVGVDEAKSPSSGCSIDSLMRVIKGLGEELSIDFFNRLIIAMVNDKDVIELKNMGEFRALMQSDTVTGQTIVYNNLVTTKEELEKNWKTKVVNSWHKNLIEIV